MSGAKEVEAVVTTDLLAIGLAAGLHSVGVAPALVQEPARTVLTIRKAAGLAGDMQFTYRNPDRSTDPETVLSGARSIIAGALAYGHYANGSDSPSLSGAVARYSWHDHYADLERALQTMADVLVAKGFRARVVADTNAMVDRNVAWQAGLGWYGKNSNLLLPGAGSWFVLGSVVTDAELEPTGPPLADGCGPCSQCIDDCPTAAIVAPGVVDATRCLAWIVQAPGVIPAQYRVAVGDRIYGCDDCQDVCPPNRRTDHRQGQEVMADPDRVRVDIEWLLTEDDEAILARHGRWYIPKRNVDHLRRTALVVLANVADAPDSRVEPLLRRYLGHPEPLLRAHAIWAAKRLGLTELVSSEALGSEDDPLVTAELDRTVEPRFAPADWDR